MKLKHLLFVVPFIVGAIIYQWWGFCAPHIVANADNWRSVWWFFTVFGGTILLGMSAFASVLIATEQI